MLTSKLGHDGSILAQNTDIYMLFDIWLYDIWYVDSGRFGWVTSAGAFLLNISLLDVMSWALHKKSSSLQGNQIAKIWRWEYYQNVWVKVQVYMQLQVQKLELKSIGSTHTHTHTQWKLYNFCVLSPNFSGIRTFRTSTFGMCGRGRKVFRISPNIWP